MLNEIDLSRTDLNLLVIFETVLTEGNVGRAADRLNLSPSAVSHGLGRLRRLLNDPLFLKTPKGVVPTARATELAEPIADILARTRRVIATAEPFNPATSKRRFMIGAPDASAFFLTPLHAILSRDAAGIDVGIRQILPRRVSLVAPWDDVFADLDAHEVDIAVAPVEDVPARFAARIVYPEEFVIAMRRGHPFAAEPTLSRYCEMRHLLVSFLGDAGGFVDRELATLGLSRRVVMTVPNFMMALAVVAETDVIAALPERIVASHAARFDIVTVKAPLMDAGLAWLFDTLVRTITEAAEVTLSDRP
jgi:DNA-binding transcriptional LysR family regulator